jgi:hypothetical protein
VCAALSSFFLSFFLSFSTMCALTRVCVRACGMGTIYDLFSCPCFFRCFVTYSIPPGIFILVILVLVFVVVVRSDAVRFGSVHIIPPLSSTSLAFRDEIISFCFCFSSLLFSSLSCLRGLCICVCVGVGVGVCVGAWCASPSSPLLRAVTGVRDGMTVEWFVLLCSRCVSVRRGERWWEEGDGRRNVTSTCVSVSLCTN